jgi:LacI family transcriptional regulator
MVTILEVAKKAGVSITTVSRVLNNSAHKVNKTTRERVLRVIESLDYQPNALAQSLLKNQSMTIGVIIPDISNPYYAEIVRGIQDRADEHGYSVLIQNTDRKMERIVRSIYVLRAKQVDGVVIAGGLMGGRRQIDNLLSAMKNLAPRTVVVGRFRSDVPSVRVDNVDAIFMAVSHLVDLKHREIAFVNGSTNTSTMEDRLRGFKKAIKHFQCPLRLEFIRNGMLTLGGGYTQVKEILAGSIRPSAVIFANDQMAFGAVKAIREAGLSIPEDMALIGFDNVPLCSYFEPSITSMEIPRYKLGYAAAELLIDLIHGRETERTRWFKVEIIKRRSTVPGGMIR